MSTLNKIVLSQHDDCNYSKLLIFTSSYCEEVGIKILDLENKNIGNVFFNIDDVPDNNPNKILLFIYLLYKNSMITYESYKDRIGSYRNNEMGVFIDVRNNVSVKTMDGGKLSYRNMSLLQAWGETINKLFTPEMKKIHINDLIKTFSIHFVGYASNYVFNFLMGEFFLPTILGRINNPGLYPILSMDNIGKGITDFPISLNPEQDFLPTGKFSSEGFDRFAMIMSIIWNYNRPNNEDYWRGIAERTKAQLSNLEENPSPKSVREILINNNF